MAYDGEGGSDSVAVTLTVTNTNDFPYLWGISDQEVDQDEELEFTIMASDPDGSDLYTSLTLSTDMEDVNEGFEVGDNVEIEGSDMYLDYFGEWNRDFTVILTGDNSMVGEYEIEFAVEDNWGAIHSTTLELTIENVNDPPYLEEIGSGENRYLLVSEANGDDKIYLDEEVTFAAGAWDIDLDIEDSDEVLTYIWDFGDGDTESGVDLWEVSHAYAEDGREYTVNLTVEDLEGLEVSTSLAVEVEIDADADSDEDGMPDGWENRYELDRFDETDAEMDADEDGVTNLQEFLDNTDPTNPNSFDPGSSGDGGEGDEESEKEGSSEDSSFGWMLLLMVVSRLVVVVVVVLLVLMKKKAAAAAAAQTAQQPPQYDPYADPYGTPPMEGGATDMGMYGAGGDAAMTGDPTAPPPMGLEGAAAGGATAELGAGGATMDPSQQLPPASTDITGMGDGSADPLEPIPEDPSAQQPPAQPPAEQPPAQQPPAQPPAQQPPAQQPPAQQAAPPAGGSACPSCGTAVQAGWFICPTCKNPLS
jgi:PKD repeat protein